MILEPWLDVLDVPVSQEDSAIVQVEKPLTVQWPREAVDARFSSRQTETRMKDALEQIQHTGRCTRGGCKFISNHKPMQVRHIESHFVLYVCGWRCGCFSSSWHTTAKHIHRQHNGEQAPVVQGDGSKWLAVHHLVPGPPHIMPRLLVRTSRPARRDACTPVQGASPPPYPEPATCGVIKKSPRSQQRNRQ